MYWLYLLAGLMAMAVMFDYNEKYGAIFALLIVFGILTSATTSGALKLGNTASGNAGLNLGEITQNSLSL